jgi:hypothetical protein
MIRKGGYTRPQLAAFALFIISAWAQDPMAQTKDDCLLDPGAKNSPLFQKQCLNAESDPEWPQAADTTKKSWRLYSSHQMDVKAGLFRDESRVALFGLGMGYRLGTSTRFTGQTGFGGSPYDPQLATTFGFRLDF